MSAISADPGIDPGSARILESITDAFFALDPDWRFRYVNAAAERLLRRPRAALLGRRLWDLYPDAVGTDFYEQYHRALREQVTVQFEAFYAPFDTWFVVHGYGSADGLSVFFQDISDRKRAEAKLVEAESHYRRLITVTPNAVYALDLAGRFVEVNPAAERLLGLAASDLLGQPFHRVMAPQSLAECDAIFRRLVTEEGEGTTVEAWVRHVDGAERLLDITLVAMRDDGRLTGYLGVARDITPERAALLALQDREERLRQIAENVNEVFWIFSPDFSRTVYMSPAYERLWGRPVDEVYAAPLSFLAAVHQDDVSNLQSAMRQVRQLASLAVEYRVLKASGEMRWVQSRGYAVAGPDGQITSVVGTTVDITERKLAELALHEQRRELQQILDALPLGVSLVDASGRQTWYNPALHAFWGGTRPLGPDRYGAHVGWHPGSSTRVSPDEWPIVRALRGETVRSVPLDVQTFDGTRKATVVSAVPLRDETGTVTGALAVQEDVTERRALEERQRMLAAVLDGLNEGACVLTADGHVLYANARVAGIIGIEPDRLPGLHPQELAGLSEAAARFPAMLQTTLETGRYAGRVPHTRPSDGVSIPLDVVLSHVRSGDGSGDLVFAFISDATRDVQREQHLRRAERLASIGTLVAGVAHELNNPLQAIMSFTQLLRLGAARQEDAEALAVMQRESERMAKIVADLKQVARGNESLAQKTAVDLNEVVQHVCRVQEYRLRTSNVDVVQRLGAALPPVCADRAELEQVLINLVVNACQAMSGRPQGGRLELVTQRAAKGAVLEVHDNGPGIAPEHLDRIFDPFFTTKAPGEGTGLGLAVVHGIVNDNGGQIRVDSRPGTGTTVIVEWPAAAAGMKSAGARPGVEAAPAFVAPQGARVLLVDDEPAIRMVLTQFLQQRGHTVHTAAEGEAALRLLAADAYDVVLSDLRMPGLDGESLLRRMRAEGIAGRVVFMTGDPSGAGALLAQPGIELLRKPMKLEDVVRVVEHPPA